MFEEDAPKYMAMGMTYDQYWGSNDPEVLREFIEADKIKQERINTEAWLYGVYVFNALASTVGNFGLKKGQQPNKYPEKPFDFNHHKETEERSEDEEDQEALRARLYMLNMTRAGKAWGKR